MLEVNPLPEESARKASKEHFQTEAPLCQARVGRSAACAGAWAQLVVRQQPALLQALN